MELFLFRIIRSRGAEENSVRQNLKAKKAIGIKYIPDGLVTAGTYRIWRRYCGGRILVYFV